MNSVYSVLNSEADVMDTSIVTALAAVMGSRQYYKKNIPEEELREMAESGRDDLIEFSEACRKELKTFQYPT